MRRFALLLFCAAAACAQVGGPMLGFTPDGSRIRPLYGLAGAGALGDPINVGRDLALIAGAPGYALATAADNGQALVIANGATAPITGVPPGAMRIAVSPTGSSAALWFSSGHFQIVSGLPNAAFVRDVDASFLEGSPSAIAVSDDGQSVAGSWANGAWLFNSNGAAAFPVNEPIEAIAFFTLQSKLVAATSQGVISIDSGAATSLYDVARERRSGAPSPVVGIGVSSDNRYVVVANLAGDLLTIDSVAGTSAVSRCQCTPEGVFGLGGSAFRLTSASSEVKVFDAETNAVNVIPPMLSVASAQSVKALAPSASLPALPAVTIGGIPSSTGYQQQPAITISIASSYPQDISGTVTLTFASSVGGDDQMIQFVSPATGRTAPFTIPAGSTTALFSNTTSQTFDTGTVAGTITLTLDFTAAGTDITPSPAPSKTYTTNPTVPFVGNVTLEQTPGGVTVLVTGFSSTREVSSGTFTFAPATGTSISDPTLTVSLSSAFATWYSNSASNAYGSQFLLTMPFPVQGQAGNLVAVTVTLTNSKGASTPVSQ